MRAAPCAGVSNHDQQMLSLRTEAMTAQVKGRDVGPIAKHDQPAQPGGASDVHITLRGIAAPVSRAHEWATTSSLCALVSSSIGLEWLAGWPGD
jgi:hypothetical protein